MNDTQPEETITTAELNDGRPVVVPDTTDVQEGDTELTLLAKIADALTP